MTPGLHIQLLGEFNLTYNGVRVTGMHSPRLRTLLAYLILHRGMPQPRQHLAFLLWPDSTEKQARTNLRNLVHLLRQAWPHSDCCLRCEGQVLIWEPHIPYTLDTAEFEAAAEADALQTAIEAYRGELLPECYSDWVTPERERLRQLYLVALERLVQQMEEARNYQAALQYAQRLAGEDPLSEAHCRSLLRLYMLAGDRPAALRTYHAFATALHRELGVEPAHATQQIYAQVLHGAATVTEPPPGSPDALLPLVGRREEWAQLLELWRSAASGHPQLALITGDVGIGKTRLAEELVTWVGRQGFPAAQAVCYAAEGSLPYSPIVTWLRSRPLPALPDPWHGEVARLLPDAPVNRRADRRDLEAPWERLRLFEALAIALFAWGRPTRKTRGGHQPAKKPEVEPLPILLFLDDLQWCDRDTLDWLHYLLRFNRQGRLLVIGTARVGDTATDQSLAPLINSLHRHGMVTEIELAPLNSAEILTLASQVAGRPLEPALAEPLHRGSEGNPLFVVEMMRAGLGRPGPWDPQHGAAALRANQPLPPKIRQVLGARLAQLSPNAQQVAELVATTGREAPYIVLARAFDGSETSLVQGLDELWRRRILCEVGVDSYDFTHARLREICYEDMSAARRLLAQHRLTKALMAD